uniref:Uncharacterized protein n=1 Tax=Oncorhynchus tshawytscha TaxID=74940 RepID=A0A8C8HHM3_ONCTS
MNWNTDCEPTSVPDLTNALVVEWKQVPATMFQQLVESLPGRVEAYFFVDIFPDQMMTEEQNLLYSKLLCELLNKPLSIAPNRYRTRMHACIYSAFGKYSDPLTFSTFC